MASPYYVATTGNDSTGDGSSGNPYATPGKALAVAVAGSAGWVIWVKAGTYNTTSNTNNIASGTLNFNQTGSQTAFNRMEGYTTTIGDGGRFTMTLGSGLTGTMVTMNNANSYQILNNIEVVGNSTSGSSALNIIGRSNRVYNFKISAFTGGGSYIVNLATNATLMAGEISGGNTSNYAALNTSDGSLIKDLWVHGNAGRGVDSSNGTGAVFHRVRSTDHTGSQGYGFHIQGAPEFILIDCVADNNAQSNYYLQNGNPTLHCFNCISTRTGGYHWDNRSGVNAINLYNCAYYSATSGLSPVTPTVITNLQALTGMPYTGSGDYNLNNTAGAGAACRGVLSSQTSGLSDNSYNDIGAVQHQDAGGGTTVLGMIF